MTGRRSGFAELRQAGGLSGYPSREESRHDYVENSHASTILSYAYGLAAARDAGRDPHRHIVAVIGDGSMTGGMAYEALNNLGHSRRRVVIVLNDNGRSYAPTVSNITAFANPQPMADPADTRLISRIGDRLSQKLTEIRLNPTYVRRQRRLEELLRDVPVVGTPAEKAVDAMKAAVREVLQPPAFFEALGVRYVGPVDGHDIPALEQAMRNAVELSTEGPIVVHVVTQKGRGYPPAEDDDEKHLHDAPVFDPLTGPPKAVPTGYTQAFAEAIIKEAEADDRIVAITAAMAGPTGLLPFQARFPDRFFDVGIAEQHAVTGAAGMAMGGLRPIVAIYSPFLNRAWDQIVYDVALHRLPVVFCIDRAGITGPDGASAHGVYDMALLSKVPGIRVLAPSSAQELQQMLKDAMDLADGGPVAIRYPRGQARNVSEHEVGVGIHARRSATPETTAPAGCACWPSASSSSQHRRRPTCSLPSTSPRRSGMSGAALRWTPTCSPTRAPQRGRDVRGRHPRRRHRHGHRGRHRRHRPGGADPGAGPARPLPPPRGPARAAARATRPGRRRNRRRRPPVAHCMTSVPSTALPVRSSTSRPSPRTARRRQALADTTALAQRAEELGYLRFWVAEHHNMPSVASTSPPVLIAHLGASTTSIRIGSGGVMLPNHAPLVVAEQFAMLEALHPGRIDLGIGRAPGTDPPRPPPCAASPDALGAEDFPRDLIDLMGLLGDERVEHGPWTRFRATPAATSTPADRPARLERLQRPARRQLGLPFGFAHHFDTGGTLQALELYRDRSARRRRSTSRTRSSPPTCSPPTRRGGRVPGRPGPPGDPRHPHRPLHAAAAAGRGRRAPRPRRRPRDAVEPHRRRRRHRAAADRRWPSDRRRRADDLDVGVRPRPSASAPSSCSPSAGRRPSTA